MLDKIKNYQDLKKITQLRDIRIYGLLVFLIIVLLITWSGIKTIQTNYDLQKQLAQLQQQNKVDQLKNTNQQLQNQYLNTNQALDISARQHFGLAQPGETLVIVPKNVALSYIVNDNTTQGSTTLAQQNNSWHQNFDAWVNFLLHRNPNTD